MRLSYLDEFLALSKSLNFRKTADELHISQSALSKHIDALENDLQTKLLERNPHHVALTSQGEMFVDCASVICTTYHAIRETFIADAQNKNSLLIGGCIDSPGEFSWLSRATAAVQARNPSFSPHFIPCSTASPIAQLVEGQIDCAIISFCPGEYDERAGEALSATLVATSPFRAVLAADHPLADREQLSLKDLDGQTIIRMMGARMVSGWNNLSRVLASHDVRASTSQRIVFSVNDLSSIALDDEVLILPECEVRRSELRNENRKVIPFADEDAFFDFSAVRLKGSESGILNDMIEELKRTPL